jgi:hypothetical protein
LERCRRADSLERRRMGVMSIESSCVNMRQRSSATPGTGKKCLRHHALFRRYEKSSTRKLFDRMFESTPVCGCLLELTYLDLT